MKKNIKFDGKKPNDDDNEGSHKLVAFKVEHELEELTERHNDEHNFFLIMSRNEEEHKDEDVHHGGSGDDVNEVPLPVAVWLFGSGLLGLLGIKRKSV
jgi:hypothetical protein